MPSTTVNVRYMVNDVEPRSRGTHSTLDSN